MASETDQDAYARLKEVIDVLDDNERAAFLYTLKKFATRKSKSTRSRCLNDFTRWIESYRAHKTAA